MPEPAAVREAFDRTESLVTEIQRYVRETLEPYCRQNTYIFIDRTKTSGSLSEKLESGRVASWSQIDDRYACTIVVPVAGHEDGVIRKLDASFDRHRIRTREETQKSPDTFRFDGARWYGRIRSEAAATRQPGIGDTLFEVQVVTAFEYAWIAVTHDLVYKADNVDWRRQRLAAQLKAAVEQVEVLIAAFDSATDVVRSSPWPESTIKAAIIQRCRLMVGDGLVPVTIVPESWRRFADNFYDLTRSFETNRYKIPVQIERILEIMDSDLRGASPLALPVGGTFFQYVLSVVARQGTPGNLDNYVVVASSELSLMYGMQPIPKPFLFDGTGSPATEPADPAAPADRA